MRASKKRKKKKKKEEEEENTENIDAQEISPIQTYTK